MAGSNRVRRFGGARSCSARAAVIAANRSSGISCFLPRWAAFDIQGEFP
jgi:hypothetical protein